VEPIKKFPAKKMMILMGVGMLLALIFPPATSPWDIMAIIFAYPMFAFMMGYAFRITQEERRSP
jgi:hypothetical protein